MNGIACPDCPGFPLYDTHAELVAHREAEHPPETKILTVHGIASGEAFGYEQEK